MNEEIPTKGPRRKKRPIIAVTLLLCLGLAAYAFFLCWQEQESNEML